MCDFTPDAPEVEIPEPEYLRNPFLDDARSDAGTVDALRRGRSSLRIPLGSGMRVGFQGRSGSTGGSGTAGARGNARVSSNARTGGGVNNSPVGINPGSLPNRGGGGGGGRLNIR